MRLAPLVLLLPLVACATPREACLRAAGAELATLDHLIVETQATLERGYALRREPYSAAVLHFCVGGGRSISNAGIGLRYCPDVETRFREVPVAIDPAAERRKLAKLRQRREEEARRAAAAAQACPG
ncbi:MAG: hypothetical protein V2I65_03695 [Paracoccaceae bacterium]|jgi:hypothetical protein|nr:hypothetical protein [Paracoccaceae bacterium]